MLKRMRLTAKIVATIVTTLVLTSAGSFWITQYRVNRQAEEAFRDKVRQIVGMASTTRAWFSENIDLMVPGRNFKHVQQVPGSGGMERRPGVCRGTKDDVSYSVFDPTQSQESA